MMGHKLLLVSSVGERDGMAIELARESGERIAEVFEDDATGDRSLTVFLDGPVPLPLIEWLLTEADRQL